MAETTDNRLRLLIERVERIEEEEKGLRDDKRDVYNEGKAVGYDPKMMKALVKLRKLSKQDRDTQDALLETYRAAVGLD